MDLGLKEEFMHWTPKSREMAKIHEWDYIKLKWF